jgi:4-diphosphocytidyl-2-C-methyl-D-erythritol kinase
MPPITLRCPAKVNVVLRILAREADGYHGIETIFCRIGLADEVTLQRTDGGITLELEGAQLGPAEENLAWRAADAVLAATGRRFGIAIRLVKRIPAGAGLGGGSSDAAAVLLGANTLANQAIPRSELFNMAHRLGADVPFFLMEAPRALAWGHGQRLLRLPALPERPLLLLLPDLHVATAEAYAWADEAMAGRGGRGAVALDLDVLANWSDLARLGGNDFESVVFGRHPELQVAFEALARTQPLLCRMSGSGSALYGVYRTERDREDAIDMLGTRHGRVVATTTG